MGNNKKNKNNEKRHADTNIDRRLVSCEMTKLFTLGAESRKNNPDRWTKEKRTKYNDRVKMIQWLFDTQQYVSAKQSLDWLDSDFQLTGRKFADKSNKNNPEK
jgi:hypothetical protein